MSFLQTIANALTKGIISVQPKRFDTGWQEFHGIATASAYTTGDVVGTPLKLTVPKAGTIDTVLVLDEDKEEIAANFALFSQSITLVADHDIFVVAVGEYERQVGDISVTNADYSTYSGSSFATVNNVGQQFVAPNGFLEVYWVTRGVPNIAVSKKTAIRFLGFSNEA